MTRDDAKEYLLNMFDSIGTTAVEHWTQADADKMRNAVEALEVMPTVDVQPVRHGHWEWIASTAVEQHGTWLPYLKEGLTVKCSECGIRFDRPWHYCPSCGATMDGESRMNLREVKLGQI